MLQDTIDDLDSVINELEELRRELVEASRKPRPNDVLWDIEYALDNAASRTQRRAASVRRVIDLLDDDEPAEPPAARRRFRWPASLSRS